MQAPNRTDHTVEQGCFAVVTGGGTAGHVLPALAVADALVADGFDPQQILYVGCQRGLETRLVPATGYPHVFLDVIGLQRSLSPTNALFGPKMVRAVARAIALLRARRPAVVVSVGGYASMPAVFAARRLGIPIVAVSFDNRPGRASTLAARYAAATAVAFPDSPLPRATVTGAPLRAEILAVDRERDRLAARRALGVDPNRFMVAVMGGSQGSLLLNQHTWHYLDAHRNDEHLAIRHAVGERFLDLAPAAVDAGIGGVHYQPIGYEPSMATVYAAADLVVGRGGASTVHEIAATGTPAILVPWSAAAEDHQTANVRWLADSGGAVLVTEDDIDNLAVQIDRLRSDPSALETLGRRAASLGQVQRDGTLATLIRNVAGRGE